MNGNDAVVHFPLQIFESIEIIGCLLSLIYVYKESFLPSFTLVFVLKVLKLKN